MAAGQRYSEGPRLTWRGYLALAGAVVIGVVILALGLLFSALFLGLFLAFGLVLGVRSWWLRRKSPTRASEVIEVEYHEIRTGGQPDRHRDGG